jgi:HEAT repeat protein
MLTPDKFAEASVYQLLEAAAQGKVGMDQRWLHAILDRGESVVPDLVRFGTEDHETDPVPVDEELMMIFRELKTPEAVPFFIDYLRRNPDELPDLFVDAMFPIRRHLLEPLIQLHEELEEDEGAEVAFALAAFRIRDERVLKILLDRLEYDTGDGAICLGLYGDPAAQPALEEMLGEVEDEHLKQDIQDAIGQLGRESDETELPFDIWSYFPEKARPESAILEEDDLAAMLDSEDSDYRFAAAAGLINRDIDESSVKKLLEKARTDESDMVRAKCWEALAGEVADDEEIYTAMLGRLKDGSVPMVERAGALVGLGQRADEKEIRRYAEEFYANPETRAAAMAAMWNSLDRSFAPFFPEHLDDPDPEIRKQAISGVGYLGIFESAEKLRESFDDDDYRPNALFAYALAVRCEVSPGRMRSLLKRIDDAAGGLTEEEQDLVELALDERLLLNGKQPFFHPDEDEPEHTHGGTSVNAVPKTGRNDPCPCGSGRKYKKCHGA